jgi:hypothetical protein
VSRATLTLIHVALAALRLRAPEGYRLVVYVDHRGERMVTTVPEDSP